MVTVLGYGKRVVLDEYPAKNRATGGVLTADQNSMEKTGKVAVARVVQEIDEVTLISSSGIVLRQKVSGISTSARGTRGFRLVNLDKDDSVASVARIIGEKITLPMLPDSSSEEGEKQPEI